MTRCLNCGAERTADSCEECGLTAALAEVALRRRVLNLTGVFLLGAMAFLPASHYYPPLELDGILIYVGVLFFLTLGLGVWIDLRARRHAELEVQKRIFRAMVAMPWLLGGLMFLNGSLDTAASVRQSTTVLGKFSMPGWVRSDRLVVRSWRAGRTIERVPVNHDDYERFRRGEEIEVVVREGLAGIPWVGGVHRK